VPEVVLVLVGTVLVFLVGGVYYALVGTRLVAAGSTAPDRMPPAAVGVEVLRCLVLSAVVTGLGVRVGVDTLLGGLLLGLVLWVGFPLVLWSGAVLHERTPWRLAAIHAGDWLLKLLALGVLVGVVT
jgi:hypothetical protein